MKLKITTGKAEWNKSKLGSDKDCVFVEFPNCISTTTGESFKWMPTYEEIFDIKDALLEIELKSWSKDERGFKKQG